MQAAPLWLYVLAALAPWLPILVLELIWTYRHYRWLAIFCLLIVTQSIYLLEHVTRMIQVHVLSTSAADAPGIFGALGARAHPLALDDRGRCSACCCWSAAFRATRGCGRPWSSPPGTS